MDPRDPDDDRIRRFDPNAPRKPRPSGQRQPPPPPRSPTGALRPLPSPASPPAPSPAQDDGTPFRLDPNSPPGEFNFIVPAAQAAAVPQVGLIAEVDGPIPPQLYKAVDEVLGFIYGLDQQFENQGRRPKK